ncbi:MAG: LLM class flavin-dependent oxidoreductase, partial [Lapillicoccus sp.]
DLPLIRDRWTKLNPAPTRDIPILIGGGGEKKTLRIVAEHASIWHTFGGPDTLSAKGAVLEEWCARVGRDPAEITWSAGVAPTPGRMAEEVDSYAVNAQALHDVGVRLFTVGISGEARDDLDKVRQLVAWRDEVNA